MNSLITLRLRRTGRILPIPALLGVCFSCGCNSKFPLSIESIYFSYLNYFVVISCDVQYSVAAFFIV